MNELGIQVFKVVLMEHFKQLMKEFKKAAVSNVVTDYPTMLKFIIKELHAEKYNNKIYHRLTHVIVPELEKEGILKRLKLYDGTFVFKINLNGVEPKRNLPKHLISPLDPEDCIHAARVCDQCDNGSEYWQYWWDQSDEKKFLEENNKEVRAP